MTNGRGRIGRGLWWLTALALSAACVETVTPGADATGATDVRPDATSPPDEGLRLDVPEVLADRPDAAVDGPASDQPSMVCAGRPYRDLDVVGIPTPTAVRFPAVTPVDDAPLETWACGITHHPLMFRFTVQTAGRVRVSTNALAASLAVYDGCPDFSAPELACLAAPGSSPEPARVLSVAPERSFAVGDTVFVVVGSATPSVMFTLSVGAAQPLAPDAPCDLRADSFCTDGAVCVDRFVAGDPPRCTVTGALGAPCRRGDAAAACDPGLTCDPIRSNVCAPALARDATCDLFARERCPTGQSCVPDLSPPDTTLRRCRDDGSPGGWCRSTLPRCDAGSACTGGRCQRPLAVGATCEVRADEGCGETASCQGPVGARRCVADGALDGRCRTTGTPCDPGGLCARSERFGAIAMCQRPIAVGAACNTSEVLDACAEGSVCAWDGTAARCTADGAPYGRCRAIGVACDSGLPCGTTRRCAAVFGVGERCDHASARWICAPGLSCELDPRGTWETPGICQVTGTFNVACRAGPSPCDAGLACSGRRRGATNGRCLSERAAGASCDPWEFRDACVAGTTCGPVDATTTACLADGARGGACRATGSPCDAGLACATLQREPFGGTCIDAIAVGEACALASDAATCATGAACLTVDGALRCVANGATGGRCRAGAPRCDEGLACGAATRCRPSVSAGGACDPRRERDACAEALACIASLSQPGSSCALPGYAEGVAPAEEFIDACDGGVRLFAGPVLFISADGERVALPFAFRAYGADVREVQVSPNGVVSLGPEPHALPNSGGNNFPWRGASVPLVAAFWDYLGRRSDAVSGVCVRTVGTAPDRRTVIGWRNVFLVAREYTHLTFAVTLHERTGVIDVRYADLHADYIGASGVDGIYAALGVQGRAGFDATAHRGLLRAPTAIRYTPR